MKKNENNIFMCKQYLKKTYINNEIKMKVRYSCKKLVTGIILKVKKTMKIIFHVQIFEKYINNEN